MRYLAGFAGGFVVAMLLFVFQDYLISAERDVRVTPNPHIFLPVVKPMRPAEVKPYDAKEPPPKPEPVNRPAAPANPTAQKVRPELPPLPGFDELAGPGIGPRIISGGGMPTDRGPGLKYPVAPAYPADALRRELEGEVEVEFTILPDGTVTDVDVIRATPPGVFEQSARRAVQRWGFQPEIRDGEPVETRVRQVIEFRLPKKAAGQ